MTNEFLRNLQNTKNVKNQIDFGATNNVFLRFYLMYFSMLPWVVQLTNIILHKTSIVTHNLILLTSSVINLFTLSIFLNSVEEDLNIIWLSQLIWESWPNPFLEVQKSYQHFFIHLCYIAISIYWKRSLQI